MTTNLSLSIESLEARLNQLKTTEPFKDIEQEREDLYNNLEGISNIADSLLRSGKLTSDEVDNLEPLFGRIDDLFNELIELKAKAVLTRTQRYIQDHRPDVHINIPAEQRDLVAAPTNFCAIL